MWSAVDMLKKIVAIFDRIISILDKVAATIVVLLMVLVCISVFARYVMHTPIDGVVQVSEYMLLLIIIFSAPLVLKLRRHVSMDIVVIRLKERTQKLISFITAILGTLICAVIVWYSLATSLDLFRRDIKVIGEFLLPQGILTGLICFCFFLLTIQYFRMIFDNYRIWKSK
jgi:C4-dicarboxylate transporter, DctQ subunit